MLWGMNSLLYRLLSAGSMDETGDDGGALKSNRYRMASGCSLFETWDRCAVIMVALRS